MAGPSKLNGSGEHASNVTSLEDARRRALRKADEKKRAERAASRGGPLGVREWLIGLTVLAMALGMIAYWLAPLVRGLGALR